MYSKITQQISNVDDDKGQKETIPSNISSLLHFKQKGEKKLIALKNFELNVNVSEHQQRQELNIYMVEFILRPLFSYQEPPSLGSIVNSG